MNRSWDRILQTGGYISASVRHATLDSRTVIAHASAKITLSDAATWKSLPGWPYAGTNFFASTPALGDIDGDGIIEVVAGSDDDCIHALRADGTPVPGWPVRTGGDVYASPVLALLDHPEKRRIVVGSDDGSMYVLDEQGKTLAGWPVKTGGFIAASAAVGDLDGDGRNEIVFPSWDGYLYAMNVRGETLPGWPVQLDGILWSSPCLADLTGDGRLDIVIGSPGALHALDAEGQPLPGWPILMPGNVLADPVVVDFGKGLEMVIGSDAIYRIHPNGTVHRGFPVHVSTYFWGGAIVADVDGSGTLEIVAGGLDGAVHAVRACGSPVKGWPRTTEGMVFATPCLLPGKMMQSLAIGSWDGNLYRADLPDGVHSAWSQFAGSPTGERVVPGSGRKQAYEQAKSLRKPVSSSLQIQSIEMFPGVPVHQQVTFIRMTLNEPHDVAHAEVHFRENGDSGWAPSPLVLHGGRLLGLIRPFPAGTGLEWRIAVKARGGGWQLWPEDGWYTQRVRQFRSLPVRVLQRLLRRRECFRQTPASMDFSVL